LIARKEGTQQSTEDDLLLIQQYMEREDLTGTVRRVAIGHLVQEAAPPERLREALEPLLEQFTILAVERRVHGTKVEVQWKEPKRPTRRPKKRKKNKQE